MMVESELDGLQAAVAMMWCATVEARSTALAYATVVVEVFVANAPTATVKEPLPSIGNGCRRLVMHATQCFG